MTEEELVSIERLSLFARVGTCQILSCRSHQMILIIIGMAWG